MWQGNKQIFKGYAIGDGKKPSMKVTGKLLSWKNVCKCDSFGAVLNDGYIDISFDSDELSQKFWEMSEVNNWKCLILENPSNGHIHSYWKIPEKWNGKDGKDRKLAVGLTADIHSGSTYIPSPHSFHALIMMNLFSAGLCFTISKVSFKYFLNNSGVEPVRIIASLPALGVRSSCG